MADSMQTPSNYGTVVVPRQNRVLRNTYWLLDLSTMGKWLFIGAVMLMVAGIANFFIQSSALMLTIIVLAIGIFSAFILHDLKRVRDGEEDNYISATLGVYLSLYNVFQSLLAL